MIAERPFGQPALRIDRAGDAKIGLGINRQAVGAGAIIGMRCPPSTPAKREFRQALGQRHHGGHGHGRRPADKDVHPQRLAAANRRRMMHADAAMDLIVQADLVVRLDIARRKAARDTRPGSIAASRADRGLRCRPAAR